MTIRRTDDTVLLEDVCVVEDAEILMQELQAGAAAIDWSGCSHLHTACLQVILAAGVPIRGSPANAALARWLAPLLQPDGAAALGQAASETSLVCLTEA
jgi:hypothetical protein